MDERSVLYYQEQAFLLLQEGKLDAALAAMDQALTLDYADHRTIFMLKCARYWEPRFIKCAKLPVLEACEYLVGQWKAFAEFRERLNYDDEKAVWSFRHLVFGTMLHDLESYNNEAGVRNPQVLLMAGLCHKLCGRYEISRKFFESACRLVPDNATYIAELADVHACLGEEEMAKLLFKEAFYLDPQAVKTETLDSAIIRRLIDSVKVQGFSVESLPWWIPVFGLLSGVFTASRELRPAEYGKLRQAIYALEREYQDHTSNRDITLPALLNKYFWMLDHAKQTRQPRHVIEELLLKVESLHQGVYKLYTR